MAPALFPGDAALAVRTAVPQRGDVIVFEHPQQKGTVATRRVMAMPGDTIALRDQIVILNGQELKRQKLGSLAVDEPAERTGQVLERWREEGPGGRSWEVLLDPRRRTRDFGPAPVTDGYFVLADSRNHGRGSNEYGVVPQKNVRGVVRYLLSAAAAKGVAPRGSRIP
jgi:signal peptidase I